MKLNFGDKSESPPGAFREVPSPSLLWKAPSLTSKITAEGDDFSECCRISMRPIWFGRSYFETLLKKEGPAGLGMRHLTDLVRDHA